MMKRITVTISEVTEAKLKEKKPTYLSLSKYINMILESSLDNLDSIVRLAAYPVGAEEISNHIDNKTSTSVNVDKVHFESSNFTSKKEKLKNSICVLGEDVGRESEGNPKNTPLPYDFETSIPDKLKPYSDKIASFWRVKKGTKNRLAWSLQMGELEKILDNLDTIIKNANKANINKMICIGDRISTSLKSIEIAEKYSNIYATVGVHPHESKGVEKTYLEQLRENAAHEKVLAIGEIGLDYYYDFTDRPKQKEVFIQQLKLAKELNLPTVVHCRDSDSDLYNCIKETKSNKGVIHCFASDLEFAKKVIDLGYLISFTGMITFVSELEKVVENISLSKIMIETDSPYLAPVPYRGKINEPAYVVEAVSYTHLTLPTKRIV